MIRDRLVLCDNRIFRLDTLNQWSETLDWMHVIKHQSHPMSNREPFPGRREVCVLFVAKTEFNLYVFAGLDERSTPKQIHQIPLSNTFNQTSISAASQGGVMLPKAFC